MSVRAVTFDFWNTLMWEEPGGLRAARLEHWCRELPDVDPEALAAAHDAAHQRYVERWSEGEQFVVADAARLIRERLDGALGPEHEAVLLEGFDEGGRRAPIHPCEHVANCLTTLKGAGVRLGIISDIGLTPAPVVRELLAREGLLELFDDTVFSDEVGHYKPSPEVFARALDGLGSVAARDAAHVGDRLRTDVLGARTAGMTAIRYRAVYDEVLPELPEADAVLDDLAELPALLAAAEPIS